MAGIAAPGLGSGLDINGIISQLMAVERQPLTMLNQKEVGYQVEISSYGSLKSVLSGLQSSLDALKKVDTFHATTGSSSNEEVMSVSADSNSVASSYSVIVNRLAQRHKMGASEFAAIDTFGGGVDDALIITSGPKSFTVDLSEAKNLEEIQAQINVDSNETGVAAGLITGDSGKKTLVLTASESGQENRVQLTFSGAIDADTFNFSTLNRDSAGQLLVSDAELDAALEVDGVTVTRDTNNVSDVVAGLTFDLKGVGQAEAIISKDPSVATNAVDDFIKAYNELKDQLAFFSDGMMSGNSLLRKVESQIRGVLNQTISGLGDFSYISQLGITSDEKTGKLQLDSEVLNSALEEGVDSITSFFVDEEGGFATRLSDAMDGFLLSGGMIERAIDGTNRRIDSIDDRRVAMERRMESIEERYRKQFTALDTLMARMTTTSDYLTQQLDILSSMLKKE